jgi:thymidine kinase
MIKVITGPMFSGKSTMLLQYADFYKSKNKKKVYFIKPAIDSRHVDCIQSRNNCVVFANPFPTNLNINEYSEYLVAFKKYKMDVVIIDEAQFFGSWIVDFVFKCNLIGVDVIVAGLDMDCFGNPFGHMGDLMCIANQVEKISAKCSICNEPAQFTMKLNDNPDVISIGGDDKYEPRCGKHLYSIKENSL